MGISEIRFSVFRASKVFSGRTKYVFTVAFDAVVDAGVVRGCNHDAAAAVKLADRIGKHGGRRQLVVDIDMDAGLGQSSGADLGVSAGIVPAVITDGTGF